MFSSTLQIKKLQAGYGTEEVLNLEGIEIRKNTVTGIMGPSGTGKTTLLKILARLDENTPSLWSEGKIFYQNQNILVDKKNNWTKQKISMLQQKSRFYGGTVLQCILDEVPNPQQRKNKDTIALYRATFETLGLWDIVEPVLEKPMLAQSFGFHKLIIIAKLFAKQPDFIILDEPFRDFAIVEEPLLIHLIKKLRDKAGVILVTHNKKYAKAVCDEIILISGNSLIEQNTCESFFSTPKTKLAKQFLLSGSAWPADEEESRSINQTESSERIKLKKQFPRLSSFYWVIPGKIGGTQKPGLLSDEAEDIRRLDSVQVDYLISLTTNPIDLSKHPNISIKGIHFPIVDMDAPDLLPTYELLTWLQQELEQGKSAVFHCKAGIGRTGTMLACSLVLMGKTASQAIESVRTVWYRYIQTDIQLEFIARFEEYAAERKNV